MLLLLLRDLPLLTRINPANDLYLVPNISAFEFEESSVQDFYRTTTANIGTREEGFGVQEGGSLCPG